ncbi:tautomerase family protein [Actinomadura madurae]|uniref:tautomerase family protein n=1 Tax=Actinomadura madurae TaxID=1993 RepID=UPI002026C2DA|nr:2-hydroxymuconate tautomerase family protein [Actinomadura madurae]MCP9951441.1 2-hydroxymuconate tautomerase family protein [Actinomadura madurae]MCP9968216.1 2-hydroxymuconate tautomerase family protein [Actinomadura madurae]MCP9980673.1 2-hydroxymuconate tautomerase family protein [Actinomadura madurae]MCQ0007816.1 2-hydroxymuconate tautomerase family protein [Actinomadura madurae]MCQ0016872.1 2-hydroxymuconate tautomerase family protein [Actinomadura madurae]
MPLIQMTMIEGRDAATKRRLIAELTEVAVTVLDAPRSSVRVILNEVTTADWGVEGEPLSDRLARRAEGDAR